MTAQDLASRRGRAVLALASAGVVAFGVAFGTPAVLEAWLFAYVLFAGLAAGGLGLLMIGHLLGGYWLGPVRDELEAAALTTPLLVLLAIPLAFGLEHLYPWAAGADLAIPPARRLYLDPAFFLVRSGIYLAVWTFLAFWLVRPGEHPARSAVGLALLAPTVTLAGIDWVMSREPEWWSTLFGFGFAVTQLVPALAGAVLVTVLRPQRPDPKRLRSMERALMTLSLLTLWLWFVQFLTIWMTNLPHEVAWYIRREEGWGFVMLWIVLPSLFAGILALLPTTVGGPLLKGAVVLLLVQHAGHMLWLVNPAVGALWPGAGVVLAVAALWAVGFAAGLIGRHNLHHGRPD